MRGAGSAVLPVRNERGVGRPQLGTLGTNRSSGTNDTSQGIRQGGELFPGLLGFSFCYPGGRVTFVTICNPPCWSKATAHTTPLLHNRKTEGNYFFFLHALSQKMEKNLVVEQEDRDTLGNDVGFYLPLSKLMNEKTLLRLKSVLRLAELVPQSYCSPNFHYL